MESSGWGIIFSSSGSNVTPKPLQLGHAPIGELNENSLGSISGIENPQTLQAWASEYVISLSLIKTTTSWVEETFNAVSTASLILERVSLSPWPMIRSIMMSMLWKSFLFSSMSSSKE